MDLKLGSRGPEVLELQKRLRRYEPVLHVDGVFGPRTERAVRLSQRRLDLYPPDGIAGPVTLHALAKAIAATHLSRPITSPLPKHSGPLAPTPVRGEPGPLKSAVEAARRRARESAMPPGLATPTAGMVTSFPGREFIIRHECQRGVSNHLHHPSMGSGVTIGPGYDMKDRTRDEVSQALRFLNVAPAQADTAAQGAQLTGREAGSFVSGHAGLLNLTDAQQAILLRYIIGHYESMVHHAITVPLHQHEFDALVSYAYNPGGGWTATTRLVNAQQRHEAMIELSRHVFSHGERIKSLAVRRAAECAMFIYGEYN